MNAHTPPNAIESDFTDLEDIVCRVRWMAAIADEYLSAATGIEHPDDMTKLCHLVRATSELSTKLYTDFYALIDERHAARQGRAS